MLGIVGYFTGLAQTLVTALVIVMEMTDNSSMLLPLMAAALEPLSRADLPGHDRSL